MAAIVQRLHADITPTRPAINLSGAVALQPPRSRDSGGRDANAFIGCVELPAMAAF